MAESKIIRRAGGVNVKDADAQATDVLEGKTFYSGDKDIKTGTIPSKSAETFTPGTTNQVISAGQYLTADQIILGDANLLPENIKPGITIFGVTGELPQPILDGLILYLDAGKADSYPGSGNTWFDLSGNDNHFTLINNPTFSNNNSGIFVFNGSNQYVTGSRPSQLVNSGDITIDMWVKWTTVGTTTSSIQVLIDNNHTGTQGFVIQDRPDLSKSLTFGTGSTTGTQVQSTFQVGDNTWRHIVVTNNGTGSMYINGILNTSNNQGRLTNLQSTVNIARWVAGSRLLNGSIGSTRIYNRALSLEEVQHNFEVDRSRFGL